MSEPADLQTTLSVLRTRRTGIRERYQVDLLGVFGSVARGEHRLDSDVDILGLFLRGTTLFRISAAQAELEDALGRAVDLVDRDRLRSFLRSSVERDLVVA